MTEIEIYQTEAEWLAARKLAVGASEVSALVEGANPWMSPLDLYARKTGRVGDEAVIREAAHWGHLLEPVIADEFARRQGVRLVDPGRFTIYRDSDAADLAATLDRYMETPRTVVEIKDTQLDYEWKDGPPLRHVLQVQAQLAVTGWSNGLIVGLLSRKQLVVHPIEADTEIGGYLKDRARAFMKCVREQEPPPPTRASDLRIIRSLHPSDNGETVTLDGAVASDVALWVAAKATEKAAKEQKEEVEARIHAAFGDATFGVLPDGTRLTLKTTSVPGRTQVVEPYSFRTPRIEKPKTKKESR